MSKRKMLMLGTSYASREMIKYAQSQGIHTIVTDYLEPKDSVAKLVSDEYWMINTSEIDTLEEKCREEGVDIVVCGVSEFNLEMCMELCKRLNLPCYCTPEAWHFSRDKADFKALCKKLNAPIPTDYYISDQLTDDELDNVVFPVMVKPVDLSGNRGISYCYNKKDLIEAYQYARSVSKSTKIVVERMLHGEEWFASYAIVDGEITLIAMNAMYAQPGEPKNCYTITTTVSNNVERFVKEINPKIEEVLREVGCRQGYAWVQVMLDEDNKFYIIEMGYRLDGDLIFFPYTEVCGFDTVKMLVDYASGKKLSKDILPKPQHRAFEKCGCAMMLWTNKGGIVKEIHGMDELASDPDIQLVDAPLLKIGGTITQYRPLGCILFANENCDDMCRVIDKVNNKVRIINENGEDVVIKYTDFDYLKHIYNEGLHGK